MSNLLNLTEAVDLTGKSKRTLQRAMSDKKLGYTFDDSGRKMLDRGELSSLYGTVDTPMTELVTPSEK